MADDRLRGRPPPSLCRKGCDGQPMLGDMARAREIAEALWQVYLLRGFRQLGGGARGPSLSERSKQCIQDKYSRRNILPG